MLALLLAPEGKRKWVKWADTAINFLYAALQLPCKARRWAFSALPPSRFCLGVRLSLLLSLKLQGSRLIGDWCSERPKQNWA